MEIDEIRIGCGAGIGQPLHNVIALRLHHQRALYTLFELVCVGRLDLGVINVLLHLREIKD